MRRPRRRWPFLVLAAVVLVGIVFVADFALTDGKIHSGVTVGDVDVSGMTKEEAASAVSAEYGPRVGANSVVFYASEEDQENPQVGDVDEGIDEQISYEESLSNRRQWTVAGGEVEASLDVDALVEEAYEVGRATGSLPARLQAAFGGWAIRPACSFNDALVTELCDQMTTVTGTKRVDFGVELSDSIAHVTDGHDGNEVTYEWLIDRLNDAFLGVEPTRGVVLETTYLPLRITEEAAQRTADSINASIAAGASFSFEDQMWSASKDDVAAWVRTEAQPDGQGWVLRPLIDLDAAKQALLSEFHSNLTGEGTNVSFGKGDDGSITVSTNAQGTVPVVSDAVDAMNQTFFVDESRTEAPVVEVPSTEVPSTLSFEDAKGYGLVSAVASFTTQYSSGAEARVNNIHTAADYLTNSIAKANGGTWSFNDVAGEATAERGYQDAGAIVGGEYSDAVGGGICQVATTVFNAVYDAGYPVEERHNHSLRIESYPEGRDAAIAYPTLDLVWQNDTSSDVLLVMTYTNSSVTATLWGVDPGYEVSTEYGEWEKGEPYTTVYKNDDGLPAGTEQVSTTGVDGSSITIVRTVKSADGEVLHEDTFSSNYAPKNEVVLKGTAQ